MSDQTRQWPAEAGENPFGAERRPSALRQTLARLSRRPEHRPPQRVRLPVYVGSFVVGVLVALAAGWHEFRTGAAFSLLCDILLAFVWNEVYRRRARARA